MCCFRPPKAAVVWQETGQMLADALPFLLLDRFFELSQLPPPLKTHHVTIPSGLLCFYLSFFCTYCSVLHLLHFGQLQPVSDKVHLLYISHLNWPIACFCSVLLIIPPNEADFLLSASPMSLWGSRLVKFHFFFTRCSHCRVLLWCKKCFYVEIIS